MGLQQFKDLLLFLMTMMETAPVSKCKQMHSFAARTESPYGYDTNMEKSLRSVRSKEEHFRRHLSHLWV